MDQNAGCLCVLVPFWNFQRISAYHLAFLSIQKPLSVPSRSAVEVMNQL